MPNPFNSQNGQQNKKATGKASVEKAKGSKPSGKLPEKTANWPKKPGKSGPNRNTTGARKVKQHADSDGV